MNYPTIDVRIDELKVTYEDDWLKDYVTRWGSTVEESPHFHYLQGEPQALVSWCRFRGLSPFYIAGPLMETLMSLIDNGQLEPIKIYKDLRINTGHKRAACMLFLGKAYIKAEIVPDDYKL